MQHIAYWTEHEFDAWCQALVSRGFREGHAGRIGAQGRFAYFVHPDQAGTVIEISETSGGKRQRFEDIRRPGDVQKEIYIQMEANDNRKFDRMGTVAGTARGPEPAPAMSSP